MAVAYPRKDPLGIFVKAFRRYGGGLEVERVGHLLAYHFGTCLVGRYRHHFNGSLSLEVKFAMKCSAVEAERRIDFDKSGWHCTPAPTYITLREFSHQLHERDKPRTVCH